MLNFMTLILKSQLLWKHRGSPGFKERDSYALQMISTYLSDGKTSKLYKKIVDDKKMALQVGAININQLDYGVYVLYGLPLGDTSLKIFMFLKMMTKLLKFKTTQHLKNIFKKFRINSRIKSKLEFQCSKLYCKFTSHILNFFSSN